MREPARRVQRRPRARHPCRRREAELEGGDLTAAARPGEACGGTGEHGAVDRRRPAPRGRHRARGWIVREARRRHRVGIGVVPRGEPAIVPVGECVSRKHQRPGERDQLDRDGDSADDHQRSASPAQKQQRRDVSRERACSRSRKTAEGTSLRSGAPARRGEPGHAAATVAMPSSPAIAQPRIAAFTPSTMSDYPTGPDSTFAGQLQNSPCRPAHGACTSSARDRGGRRARPSRTLATSRSFPQDAGRWCSGRPSRRDGGRRGLSQPRGRRPRTLPSPEI